MRVPVRYVQAAAHPCRASVIWRRGQALTAALKPSVEKKLDEIERSARNTETALATFTSRRDTALTQPSADRKAALAAPRPEPAAEA